MVISVGLDTAPGRSSWAMRSTRAGTELAATKLGQRPPDQLAGFVGSTDPTPVGLM